MNAAQVHRSVSIACVVVVGWWISLACAGPVCAQLRETGGSANQHEGVGRGGLTPVPFQSLSHQQLTPYGQKALSFHPERWKHSESEHFIYHYQTSYIATPVAVEAEFYYRVIASELQRDTSQWERKAHIYLFETESDWAAFRVLASLDPWTGGIHVPGELFIMRLKAYKFKGHALGHEVCHLVMDRFLGSGVPRWLEEGYAENVSRRAYASYMRARGYDAKPWGAVIPEDQYIPLDQLTSAVSYPQSADEVAIFYQQSERLVRFLFSENEKSFFRFLFYSAEGNLFENALRKAYGNRWPTLSELDRAFRAYATQEYSGR